MIDIVPDRVRGHRPAQASRRPAPIAIAALAMIAFVVMLPACTPGRSEARTDLAWPWWPNRMWISDITRVGRPDADGLRRLEVRVCFEDPEGDSAKACGTLEIRVDRPTERDDPVTVVVDLDDPKAARRHHERVTECYMIPVEVDLPGLVAGRRLRIIATYRGRDGAVLRDEHEVTLTGPMQE
jgi:hypothetical protein